MVRYGRGHGTVRGTVLAEAWCGTGRGHGTVQGRVMVQYRAGPWYNLGQGHGTDFRNNQETRSNCLVRCVSASSKAMAGTAQTSEGLGWPRRLRLRPWYGTGYRAWVMVPWSRVTGSVGWDHSITTIQPSAVLSVPSERGSSCKRSDGCTTSAVVWNPSVLFEAEPYLGCSARGNG